MFIYMYTSKSSNKSYIGKTTRTIRLRFNQHKASANGGSTTHFHKALRLYGVEDFELIILRDGITDHKVLSLLEVYYIAKYHTFTAGYNQTKGYKHTIANIIKSQKRTGILHPSYGKKRPEHSEFMKGRCVGELNPMFGKVVSEEIKQKISDGLKNCVRSMPEMSSSNNPRALVIGIYNNSDELIYVCHGDFKRVCYDNKLPYNALKQSKRFGTRVFDNITANGLSRITTSGMLKYMGWYAKNL